MSSRTAVFMLAIGAALLPAGSTAAGPPVVISADASYPEGPVAVDGLVFYAEMGADRVMAWDGAEVQPVWSRPGCWPTSVARGGGDTLLVLCHREGAVVRISTAGNTLAVIDRDAGGRPFVNPNASVNDGMGGVYLSASGDFSPTAPATGAILRLDPAGAIRRVAEGIHYANGVAVSPDGAILYVSEHLQRQVLAYDVAADGSLSGRRVFVRLDDLVGSDPARSWEVGPDGLAVDSRGNLTIAEYGGGRLIVVGSGGALLAILTVPQTHVTATALIDDERRLFVTAPASLYDPKAPGGVYVFDNPVVGRD
jgi:gluconolactonase